MYLVHLILENPGVSNLAQADADRARDFLNAHLSAEAGVQHIWARVDKDQIDLGLFFGGDCASAEVTEHAIDNYIRPLISQLGGWVIVAPKVRTDGG